MTVDLPLGPGRLLRPFGILLHRSLSNMTRKIDIVANSNNTKAIMIGREEDKSKIVAIVEVKDWYRHIKSRGESLPTHSAGAAAALFRISWQGISHRCRANGLRCVRTKRLGTTTVQQANATSEERASIASPALIGTRTSLLPTRFVSPCLGEVAAFHERAGDS